MNKTHPRKVAENIIREWIKDIRYTDLIRYSLDRDQTEVIMDLIESATITVRWNA